ncbi:MAG: MaoC family dehydratase N-terminal domain-containing protein [Haloarculaceae archaeon]
MTGTLERLESMVGERVRTVEGFTVEAGKVEEFARAVGDDDPVYRDPEVARERGFEAVPAPLTFARTTDFPRYRTDERIDLGFRPEHTLHGEQAYEYDRPLVVGDRLTGETAVVNAYEREGRRGGTMTFAAVETEFRDRSGERVFVSRATAIETDGTVGDGSDGSDAEGRDAGDGTVDSDAVDGGDRGEDPEWSATDRATAEATAPTPVGTGDVSVGDRAPTVSLGPLDRRDFVRYAGASGDFNPIHYDEPYARAAGNPAVFGQGMFTAGVATHAVGDWLGVGSVRSFDVRFRSRVWPGDTLTTSVEATDVEPVEEGERVVVELRVEREAGAGDGDDAGETVITGSAEAVV